MRHGNDFLVGVVILATAVTVTGATLWVRQADIGRDHRHLVARFRDAGNVQLGNAVVIRGVRAGRIEAMELGRDGWVHVRLLLDGDIQLPDRPVVLANESSLFGEWQATIVDRDALPPNREVREQVAAAERDADGELPGATLPDLAQLTAVAGRIAGDVASVAGRVQVAFTDSAAREVRASIHNVSVLSSDLSATVQRQSRNLDSIALAARLGFAAMQGATQALQRSAARVDTATSGAELQATMRDVRSAAGDLRATMTRLDSLSRALAAMQGHVTSLAASADSITRRIDEGRGTLGLLVNDPSLYRHGDSLALELRDLVRAVKANPKRYLSLRVF